MCFDSFEICVGQFGFADESEIYQAGHANSYFSLMERSVFPRHSPMLYGRIGEIDLPHGGYLGNHWTSPSPVDRSRCSTSHNRWKV